MSARMVTSRLDPRARCHYCGEAIGLTRDHIVPRALGGPDEPWNIVPACKPCNQAKASRLPTCTCDTCADALARVHPMARTAVRTGGAA